MINLCLSLVFVAGAISILVGAWRKGIAEPWMLWLALSAFACLALRWTTGIVHEIALALYLAYLSIFAFSWLRSMASWDQPGAQQLLSYRAAMLLGERIATLYRLVIRAERRQPESTLIAEEPETSARAEEVPCSVSLSTERVTEDICIVIEEEM